jgi:hypothetical protein
MSVVPGAVAGAPIVPVSVRAAGLVWVAGAVVVPGAGVAGAVVAGCVMPGVAVVPAGGVVVVPGAVVPGVVVCANAKPVAMAKLAAAMIVFIRDSVLSEGLGAKRAGYPRARSSRYSEQGLCLV